MLYHFELEHFSFQASSRASRRFNAIQTSEHWEADLLPPWTSTRRFHGGAWFLRSKGYLEMIWMFSLLRGASNRALASLGLHLGPLAPLNIRQSLVVSLCRIHWGCTENATQVEKYRPASLGQLVAHEEPALSTIGTPWIGSGSMCRV